MAIDITRAEVEHIKEVLTGQGYYFSGYSVNPNSVTITITRGIVGMAENEITLTDNKLKRLLDAFKWNVITSQRGAENIVTTAERARTISGIV
jgi:hypothetical protein